MNTRFSKMSSLWGCTLVTAALPILALAQPASAETLARSHGRCKLTSGTYVVFDGYCVAKQKQQGGTTLFVVELDNGSKYSFSGPNKQALQVETYDGIHNVQFTEDPDKGVFVWQEDGNRSRLSVKLDEQHSPNVSHDAPTPSLGTALGTLAGALIGNLITGGKPVQQPSRPTPSTPSVAMNPYSGKGYTATASFRCSVGNDSHNLQCPGGIMRKGNGVASVTVLFPNQNEVQYDFRGGAVTTTFQGPLDWGKDGDQWFIGVDRNLFIIIPDAAIFGG